MSEQTADAALYAAQEAEPRDDVASAESESRLSKVLWTVAQPVLVLGSMLLVATMVTGEWMNHKLYAVIMIVLPIPLLLVAERVWTKRRDWILKPNELAEDGFWIALARCYGGR